MRRGLFNIAATLSLLLCFAMATLSLLTRRNAITLQFIRRGAPWQLSFHSGGLYLDNDPERRLGNARRDWLEERLLRLRRELDAIPDEPLKGLFAARHLLERTRDAPERSQLLSKLRPTPEARQLLERQIESINAVDSCLFLLGQLYSFPRPRLTQWSISLGAFLAATAALPALRLSLFLLTLSRRRSLRKQTRCPHCSYDLRATPSGCPECGRSPAD